MTINLSNEDAQLFMQNGYTKEQVGATVNHYREQGLSDDDIQAKLNARVAGWKTPQQPTQKVEQSTQQPEQPQETPTVNADGDYSFNLGVEENVYNHDKSKWHDNLRQFGRNTARVLLPKSLENKFIGSKEDEEFLSKYNDSNVPTFEQINADYKAGRINKNQMLEFGNLRKKLDELRADSEYRDYRNKEYGKEALLLGTAGIGGGAGLGLKGLAGAAAGAGIGGASYGLGNSIVDENLNPLVEVPKEAALWAGTAGALGKGGAALAKTKAGQAVLQKSGELLGKFGNTRLGQELTKERQIIRPSANKPAEDITAQLNEIKKYRQTNQQALQEELNRINQEYQAELQNVSYFNPKAGIDKYYQKLIRDTKHQYNTIDKELQNQARQLDSGSLTGYLRNLKDNIKNIQFTKKNLQVVHGSNGKGGTWTNVLQNEDNAVIQAERDFNDIIGEIAKNPQRIYDKPFLNNAETRIQKIIEDSPYPNDAEFANSFWERYTKAVDDAYNYNKLKGIKKPDYFGADVPDNNLPPMTNKSKLTQTMADRGTLPPELRDISPEYQVLHNAELQNQAAKEIANNPEINTQLRLKAADENADLSALDFETARQTLQKLYSEGKVEEALELTDLISKKASKAGQSVQALSLWSRTTPEGAIRQAQKIIADYNRTAKKKIPDLTAEQAQKIQQLSEQAQATELGTRENQKATQLLFKELKELVPASAGSKIRTLQNISLLLNPKTFLRNLGGNSIYAAMDTGISKPIAAGIDKVASLFTKKRTRVLPQLKEYAQGLQQGFREGAEDVALGINTRDKLGSRFNLNDRSSFNDVPGLNQLEKALNYSLQVPDRMFYQAAYSESLANQLRAAGVKEATPEMIQNATNDALEAVFQNNSALGNMALRLRQAGNELANVNGFGLGDAFIPYAQTPANVAQQGINYSPLGIAKGIRNLAQGNQRQGTMDLARGLTGSGLIYGGYQAAKNGLINPNIDDYKVQQNYAAMGIRPNTINIGDYNVSYNQLQPLAAPIAAGAALADVQDGNLMGALDRSIDSIADLSMLQSLNKFMADRQDYGTGTATTNLISSIPSRFVPTGLKQITDLTDNIQRDTYDRNPLKQGLNQAIAKVPGLNRTLPVKYDVAGQPIKKYQTEGAQRIFDAAANPVFVNKRRNDATTQKLIDLYESTGDKSVLLPLADKTVRFKDLNGKQVVRPLNSKERNQYQQQLGVINKQLLDDIVNTQFYNSLDDEDKINLITTTQRYAKGFVDEELWGKPSAQKRNLIRRLTASQKDKVMRKIMKTYKDKVLPVKTQNIYNQNFR